MVFLQGSMSVQNLVSLRKVKIRREGGEDRSG